MIVLGVILLILGFVFGIHLLWVLGDHFDRCWRGDVGPGIYGPFGRWQASLVLNRQSAGEAA